MSRYDHIVEIEKGRYDRIEEVAKFNPYHDSRGRFSTADGAASFTYKPGQGAMYDNAIRREKERMAAQIPGPKKGLADGLGEEHAKAIEKLIQDNSPQAVKDMWNRFGDDIEVGDAKYERGAHCSNGKVYLDVEKDAAGYMTRDGRPGKSPYQVSIHESAHAVDDLVSGLVGYEFAVEHNGRKFESLLIKESNAYIKAFQKNLQAERGYKVNIEETRKALSASFFAEKDNLSTGMLSDILGGATKGKFVGTSGHPKDYWTGFQTYYGKVPGKSVATEAWAHFTSIAANEKAAARLKSVFPESYNEYLSMCEYAATL